MADIPQDMHGLEAFLGEQSDASDAGVQARIVGKLGQINLRADVRNGQVVAGLESALGQPLPLDPNSLNSGQHRIAWLGPDEWLVMTEADVPALIADIEAASPGAAMAVNDVSGGQVALELRGAPVRELLAKGCTLDLHPAAFGPGRCAQSGLAKANVLLCCYDDESGMLLVVRRSFADYLCRWLAKAGEEYGIAFTST